MTENNIHRLGNVTFRLWYNISLIGNDSRARIAVFTAVFPTLFSASCPKFLHSFHSCRNFGHSAENKVGNTAGKTAIRAIESFPIDEILYQSRNVSLPNLWILFSVICQDFSSNYSDRSNFDRLLIAAAAGYFYWYLPQHWVSKAGIF